MPLHIITQSKLAKMHTLGRWAMQAPAPQLVFGKIKSRHRPNHDVVQRHRNRSRDLIAAAGPRHSNRQQRLERIQRREAKENSDARPESYGMRRVRDRHQSHVMCDEPLLQSRESSRQSRLINRLGCSLRILDFQLRTIHNVTNNCTSPTMKAMRRRIALQSTACKIYEHGCPILRKLWECVRVLAPILITSAAPLVTTRYLKQFQCLCRRLDDLA